MEKKLKDVTEFLHDVHRDSIFSYDDYRQATLENKLKKISMLNEYYKILFGDVDIQKLPVYIDFDGVILDTITFSNGILLSKYGIDLSTHSRSKFEDEKIVANFFATLDWKNLLDNAPEINESKKFLKLIKESIIYDPMVYSAVNSLEEKEMKKEFLLREIPTLMSRYILARYPKICSNPDSILIDDDDFNLTNWEGRPLHFNSEKKSIFPSIDDLGELYYLFPLDFKTAKVSHISGLYDECIQSYDTLTRRRIWQKKKQ